MKFFFISVLIISCCKPALGQQQQDDQTVVVYGTSSKEIQPESFEMYFTVQKYTNYDTDEVKSYQDQLKLFYQFVKKYKLKNEPQFVKRFDDDYSGKENFGMFRLQVPSSELNARIADSIDIPGVEVHKSKYKYALEYNLVRAELTPVALQKAKDRASEIAEAMGMKLGKVIQVQESEGDRDAFFRTESDDETQKVSCTLFVIYQVLPKD